MGRTATPTVSPFALFVAVGQSLSSAGWPARTPPVLSVSLSALSSASVRSLEAAVCEVEDGAALFLRRVRRAPPRLRFCLDLGAAADCTLRFGRLVSRVSLKSVSCAVAGTPRCSSALANGSRDVEGPAAEHDGSTTAGSLEPEALVDGTGLVAEVSPKSLDSHVPVADEDVVDAFLVSAVALKVKASVFGATSVRE